MDTHPSKGFFTCTQMPILQDKFVICTQSWVNHLHSNRDEHVVTIVFLSFWIRQCHAGWLPLVHKRFIINESVATSITCLWTWCHRRDAQAQTLSSNRRRWFFWFYFLLGRAHVVWKQWNSPLVKVGLPQMRTPTIPSWFLTFSNPGKILLGKQQWITHIN